MKAPDYMPIRARTHFRKLVNALDGVLEPTDREGLIAAVASYEVATQAVESLFTDGPVAPDFKGSVKKSPAWQIAREGFEAYRAWTQLYGLSPKARANLKLDDADDLETLLGG